MVITEILGKLADVQEKYPLIVLSLVLIATLFFGFYALRLETDASLDRFFSSDSETLTLKRIVSNEFGSTDQLFILVAVDEEVDDRNRINDVRHPSVLAAMSDLRTSLLQEQAVASVFSIADLYFFQYGKLPETLQESKELFAGLQVDTGSLVSRDFAAANMIIDMDISSKIGAIEEAQVVLEKKLADASKPAGIKYILTGEPTLINRIIQLLIDDNLKTVGIALVAVFIILSLFFRSPIVGFIAVVPVFLTLTWLSGALVLLGIRITMMTAAVGAMMVGMGIDYSIHMTHRYQDLLKQGKTQITKPSVVAIGGALVASAFTTFAGFAAMLFGAAPTTVQQGTALSLGIIFAFLATMLALPPLLVLHRKLRYSDLDNILFRVKGTPKKGRNILQPVLRRLAKIQTTMPKTVLAIFFIITLLLIPGMLQVRLDTKPDQWMPVGDASIESLDELERKFGGLRLQNFLVRLDPVDTSSPLDLRDPAVLQQIANLDRALEKLEFVDAVRSPTDNIQAVYFGGIPKNREEIKNIIDADPQIRQLFSSDFTSMKLVATSDSFGNVEGEGGDIRNNYREMLLEIESIPFPDGVSVVGQGGEAQFIELDRLLQQDIARTTLIGFAFVMIIAALLFRSAIVGFLAFIPIIFALLWTVSIMGYIGLPFNVLTTGMLALIMGIGIDFSIHLIHGTRHQLQEGKSIQDAIIGSLSTTGEAMSVSTLTTVAGFSALFFATLLGTQRMGFTLAIAIVAAYISCIIIVPPALVIEHQWKNRKKHGVM